jgi:hypothetical protein
MAYKNSEARKKQEERKKFSETFLFHQLHNEVAEEIKTKGLKRIKIYAKQITNRVLEIPLAFCGTIRFENTSAQFLSPFKPRAL